MATLELVDYIFDRYAYLNLSREASTDVIRREIRIRRAENHSDKLANVSDEIQQAAARTRARVDDCARVLLDDQLRAAFDARLADFEVQAPHLVSVDGIAKFDPTRYRIDLDGLLQAKPEDLSQLETQAALIVGHDERRLSKARARFARESDSWDYRDELRDQLNRAVAYVTVMEDYYWQRAGVNGAVSQQDNFRATSAEHYERQFEAQLATARERTQSAVIHRQEYAALGFAPVLLLGYAGVDGQDNSETTTALQLAAVREFDLRAEDLRKLVDKKKALIAEVAKVSRRRWINRDAGSAFLDVLMVGTDADYDEDWPGADFRPMPHVFRIDMRTHDLTAVPGTFTPEVLASWPNALVLLQPNSELPPLMEAATLADELLETDSSAG